MRRSHSADYGSRLRSDSATTRKVKKSDYYPQWSGMSYLCLNEVVYVRNRVLRIGNGPERSAKHSRQLGASRNIRETQPILSGRITIVTMSWHILLYRIKIVTMSCVVWTVSGQCPMDRYAVVMNGHDLEKFFIAVSCRLSPDCVQILPNASVHCPVTVWSLSDRIRENRDAVGTDSVVVYHAEDTNRIRYGLRTGESWRIRLETAESGRFLNNIWL